MRNCDSKDPSKRQNFEQPVWQTAQMFVGEAGCFLVVGASKLWSRYRSKGARAGYESIGDSSRHTVDGSSGLEDPDALQPGVDPAAKPLEPNDENRQPLGGWRLLLMALPAGADLIGTTLMNVGLLFVAASIYQMTRGALVLFVGLFSVIFLKRHLNAYKWLALFIVVAGVAIVGLAGVIEQKKTKLPGTESTGAVVELLRRAVNAAKDEAEAQKNHPTPAVLTLLGIFCISLAQTFAATQFVLEESILHRYSLTPLSAVGWEGTFGLLLTLTGQLIMHFAYGRTPAGQGGYFDASTGWHEMTHNRQIAVTSVLCMISIGGFNYFGLSVTRTVSATSRSTIDTCRTLFIWVVSLGLGWESFKWLQVLGFAVLVYGTFLFNELVRPPRAFWRSRTEEGELLPERPIEHS